MQMKRELDGAMRRDRKQQRQAGQVGNILRSVLVGRETHSQVPDLEYPEVMRQWMVKMRDYFAQHVIRRTVDSVNNKGEKIFGLKTYSEHYLLVKMFQWETDNLLRIAQNMVKDNPLATLIGAAKVCT